jgi:hypothetical protein
VQSKKENIFWLDVLLPFWRDLRDEKLLLRVYWKMKDEGRAFAK